MQSFESKKICALWSVQLQWWKQDTFQSLIMGNYITKKVSNKSTLEIWKKILALQMLSFLLSLNFHLEKQLVT